MNQTYIYCYGNEQQEKTLNNTYLDAEMLYEKRSKSVLKRRDEMQKKKEDDKR